MNNLLDDNRVGGGVIRDVTERVRAEEEVRRLNAELERRVAERTAELRGPPGHGVRALKLSAFGFG